jgi:FtsH ternary system domain X7
VAARFGHPAAAAGYLGQLLDGAPRNLVVRRGDDAWWVEGDVSLSLARELARLSGGRIYAVAADVLLLDAGWGPTPEPGQAERRPMAGLAEVPAVDLVREAGLRLRPGGRPRQLNLLARAERAAVLIRRGLDLGLVVSYRPVRVIPLFAEPGQGESVPERTLTEVRLQAVQRETDRRAELPASLVTALDRDPQALICRSTGRLMIQHGWHSPLSDHQLEYLVQAAAASGTGPPPDPGNTWVLAEPAHGCWNLVPLARSFTDGWQLIQLGPAHRLKPGDPALADEPGAAASPVPSRLTVVRTSRTGDPLDALLLEDADLRYLRTLLEGHPLAALAQVVPGRGQHLLLAPGGIIERIPIGRYLARVGPVPVYVAHGWRTEPRLPAAAWQELVAHVRKCAFVLEPERTLVFDQRARRPVWELWAGEMPPFDDDLTDDTEVALSELDTTDPAGAAGEPWPPAARPAPAADSAADSAAEQASWPRRWIDRLTRGATGPAIRRSLTWQEQAMDAVLAGDPERAAQLHEQHGDYIRAARLFEDAAALKEGPG